MGKWTKKKEKHELKQIVYPFFPLELQRFCFREVKITQLCLLGDCISDEGVVKFHRYTLKLINQDIAVYYLKIQE